MLRIFRYLSAFCGFLIILLCYFIHTVNILYRDGANSDWAEKNYEKNVAEIKNYKLKKIVAYSLLKQIENDSEEYFCGEDFKFEGNESRGMWTRVTETEMFVFSVHLDDRLTPYIFVRFIAMTKGVLTDDIYCQIMSQNNTYHFTKAVITPIWSKGWNQSDSNVYLEPVLLTCRIKNNITPKFISLNTKSCRNPKNYFKIERNSKEKTNFTVCVKPLSFTTDISKELIQWIIMNELLGADKIVLYYHMVKNKTRNLLQWLQVSYKNVEVKYFKPVKEISNYFDDVNDIDVKSIWQKRKYELTAYNDCFYHNLNSNYVIPLDIDEIIVPKRDDNWKDLFRSLSGTLKGHFASFSVRNTYYFRELDNKTEGEPVFFFKHVSRSKLSDKEESGKSFISSTNSLTVFNHYALHTLKPGISRTYFFSSRRAQLNHYRRNCSIVILPECDKYISSQRFFDPVIFKYKDEFYSRYRNLSEQLEFLKVFG